MTNDQAPFFPHQSPLSSVLVSLVYPVSGLSDDRSGVVSVWSAISSIIGSSAGQVFSKSGSAGIHLLVSFHSC